MSTPSAPSPRQPAMPGQPAIPPVAHGAGQRPVAANGRAKVSPPADASTDHSTVATGTAPVRSVAPQEVSDTVTPGMRIAAAWSWRLIVVVAAVGLIFYGIRYLSEITIPIVIALLLSALLTPARRFLVRHGWKNTPAAVVVFVAGLLVVAGIVTLVIEQFVKGSADLANRVSDGVTKVQDWLVTGPFHVSQTQINSTADAAKKAVVDNKDVLTSGALTTASTVGKVVTGLVLVLFILFFFLRDGAKIWSWLVGLAPARARQPILGAGDRAWVTLTGYVHATVLVAFVDAVGIGLGLVILGVPLAVPLTAFVFLSSFIPIVGALVSGIVAVLVALVTVGVVKAAIVLAVVILVQQLESHVLQPVLMGRAVHLHPLAVALSIASGVIIGGIVGGLLAVPIAACVNAAGKYLAGRSEPTDIGKGEAALTE